MILPYFRYMARLLAEAKCEGRSHLCLTMVWEWRQCLLSLHTQSSERMSHRSSWVEEEREMHVPTSQLCRP